MIALHKKLCDNLTHIICKTSNITLKHQLYTSANFPFILNHCAYLINITLKICTSTSNVLFSFLFIILRFKNICNSFAYLLLFYLHFNLFKTLKKTLTSLGSNFFPDSFLITSIASSSLIFSSLPLII